VSSVVDAAGEGRAYRFVIRHSTFVIASIPAFVFLEFFAKVLFPKNLNHRKQFRF
jgi:hypothetical protein